MNHDHHLGVPRRVTASRIALFCLALACSEVSNAGKVDTAAGGGNGLGSGSGVGANAGGTRQTATPGGSDNAAGSGSGGRGSAGGTAPIATFGGVVNTAGASAGGDTPETNAAEAGARGVAPEVCALWTDDGASSNGDASGPVGQPPNGYLVYLAETPERGKQVFHVRIHDGVVSAPVRLTPDAGIYGYSLVPQRRATLTVTRASDSGFRLTLVDFDESGATSSLSLPSSKAE